MRQDGRRADELRPVEFHRGYTNSAPGSVLVRTGGTLVLCTASIADAVPAWREASGAGWLTAEYDMLPGATDQRRPRDRASGRVDGRAQEIQRLVGRALRVAVDLRKLGKRTIYLDCDVLQADGGTRTAAINGAYVALCDALAAGQARGWWGDDVRTCAVGAVSVGIVAGEALLDLNYGEDVAAEVDCNLVMTDGGAWIEVQATGERGAFQQEQLTRMTDMGRRGIERLLALQREALR